VEDILKALGEVPGAAKSGSPAMAGSH